MRKIIPTLLFFISCSAPKQIINNAPSSYTFETQKPFEQVWSNVIDYVTSKGVSIKNIDKASGIIVTDDYSLTGSYTYEDKNGNLQDPGAYVLINKIKSALGIIIPPSSINGNYNIRVKPLKDNSGTSVTVNLVNLKGYVIFGTGYNRYNKYYIIKSTNVFEKQLAEKLL